MTPPHLRIPGQCHRKEALRQYRHLQAGVVQGRALAVVIGHLAAFVHLGLDLDKRKGESTHPRNVRLVSMRWFLYIALVTENPCWMEA